MSTALHTEFKTIAALRDALNQRQISAVDIAQSALNASQQPTAKHLNCFLDQNAESTLAQAKAADAAIAAGTAGPLAGIPIAH